MASLLLFEPKNRRNYKTLGVNYILKAFLSGGQGRIEKVGVVDHFRSRRLRRQMETFCVPALMA